MYVQAFVAGYNYSDRMLLFAGGSHHSKDVCTPG